MTMKRGIGKHYVKDVVKDHILLYLWEKFEATGPDATGPDIRENVRDNFGVRERSGVDKHLEALRKSGLITKDAAENGKEKRWKINPSLKSFEKTYKKIQYMFQTRDILPSYNNIKGEHQNITIMESRYVQEIIMPLLVERIRSSNINQQIKEELYATLGISLNALTYATTSIGENNFSMRDYRNRLFADLYNEEVSKKSALGCRMILQAVLHTKNDKAFKIGHQFIWGNIEDFGKPERKKRRRNGKAKTATDTEKQLKKAIKK